VFDALLLSLKIVLLVMFTNRADIMVCKDGSEYCLEINDSSIGRFRQMRRAGDPTKFVCTQDSTKTISRRTWELLSAVC
jgi:hypothetical protein